MENYGVDSPILYSEEMTEFEEGLKRRVEFLITAVDATDAPAFCTKIIAEKYKKDFWDLWETVKDVVSRKLENEYYLVPYQTEDFLNISKDDNYYQIYTFNNFGEETSKRRLKCTWDIMPHNEKNNMARVKLRRYMALLGNTQLRKRVFGF